MMDYALDRFEQQVRALISATGRIPPALVEVTAPKPNIPADLAFPAFRAAKELGVKPPELAQELAAAVRVEPGSLVGGSAVAGPYVNFTLDAGRLTADVLDEIARLGPRYGHDDQGAGKLALIEFSSPNIAKRMHVGHIRSTIIGQALLHIYTALGYRTTSDNHLGDWGKQFGVLLTAVRHEGRPAGEGEEALAALEQIYAKYSALAERDPAIDDEARSWSLRLEQGDPQARELWQWIVDLSLRANQRMYDRLQVHFDTMHGESFYENKMAPVLAEALERQVAYRDENGALVVELPGLPTFLLQRTDGGTLYLTRDAATVIYREREYHPSKVVYIVGSQQDLHFRQLFALMRALDHAKEIELVHVSFGTVFDQHGQPLSTRRGNMVYLESLLNEAHERARAVVEHSSPDLPDEEKEQVAEMVGVGAVIYNDLYQDPRRNITLDWERMMALEGNSAPYIQYMYARCRSILRKALLTEDGGWKIEDGSPGSAAPWSILHPPSSILDGLPKYDPAVLAHPSEVALVKQLARLPGAVREAGARYAPFVIADWCYETARALSAFYRDCPVLKAEATLRAARLHLVAATAQALKNGLGLLGIRAPERM